MRLYLVKNKSTIKVELRDEKGLLHARVSSKFSGDRDFKRYSAELGIGYELLRAAVDSYENGGPSEIDLGRRRFTVNMRPIASSESVSVSADTALEAIGAALKDTESDLLEPVIYWDGCSELAALDMDMIEGHVLTDNDVLTMEGVPTPAYSWVTKSGGLRMIYTAQDPFTAEEIAAVAYLSLMTKAYKSMEIKHETRHPGYVASDGNCCGQVFSRAQHFDPSHLRRWLNIYGIDDEEVKEYLEKNDLSMGAQYEHDRCPVSPDRPSHGKPVAILDKGIHCFSCEAYGIVAGSSKPGFFPYTYLCGNHASTVVYRCMENKTHWEHAKYVLESKLGITGRYASLVYSAGLLLHGFNRDVVDQCLTSGRNLIRMADRWTNISGETYSKDIKPLLASIPACQDTETGVPSRARIAVFEQPFDLSPYGYTSIKPVYGIRIGTHYLPDREVTAVIHTRELADDALIRMRPYYRASAKRVIDPWSIIERTFPRINRRFLELLICARGSIELGMSMPPMLFVTGPTGAGKSLTVFLAASICGDRNTEVVWTSNIDRLRQSVMDANGAFVTFNEVMKESKNNLAAMDFLLNMTPDSVSHYMYLGPMRMGRLPVMVLTDTEVPTRIKQDAQLARRIIHVPLDGQVDWEASFSFTGLRHPGQYRQVDEQIAEACNSIVSAVIDTHFREYRTFESIAASLGYNRLSKSDEAQESKQMLRQLFEAVCKAADATVDWASGSGWRLIRRDLETDIRKAWMSVCDESFTSSRRCSEEDWSKLLATKEPTRLEIRASGSDKVAVRFRSASGKINQEIL